MNLIKIGDALLNVDRLNRISEHEGPLDPAHPGEGTITRLHFDDSQFDLSGMDAKIFRRWCRHVRRRRCVLSRRCDTSDSRSSHPWPAIETVMPDTNMRELRLG